MLNSPHTDAIPWHSVYNGLPFLYRIYTVKPVKMSNSNPSGFRRLQIKHQRPSNHSSSSGLFYTCLMHVNNIWHEKENDTLSCAKLEVEIGIPLLKQARKLAKISLKRVIGDLQSFPRQGTCVLSCCV